MEWIQHYEQAMREMGEGEFVKARQHFQTAITYDPQQADLYAHAGFLEFQFFQNLDAGQKLLQKSLQIDQYNKHALLNHSLLLMKMNRLKEAVTTIKTLLNLYPQEYKALHNLGQCYARAGHLPSAKNYLRAALKLYPAFLEAELDLIAVLFAEGCQDEAEDQLRQCELKNPRNKTIAKFKARLESTAKPHQSTRERSTKNPQDHKDAEA